jgi:hypothetical protein
VLKNVLADKIKSFMFVKHTSPDQTILDDCNYKDEINAFMPCMFLAIALYNKKMFAHYFQLLNKDYCI